MALFHTINECPAVLVGIVNRVKKSGVSHFLLFQNRGIPLFCKRIGIQDLISTAGRCGERNQDIRLPECKNSICEILALRKPNVLSARISQMEFAPALETIRSAAANKCFSGLSTYSY